MRGLVIRSFEFVLGALFIVTICAGLVVGIFSAFVLSFETDAGLQWTVVGAAVGGIVSYLLAVSICGIGYLLVSIEAHLRALHEMGVAGEKSAEADGAAAR